LDQALASLTFLIRERISATFMHHSPFSAIFEYRCVKRIASLKCPAQNSTSAEDSEAALEQRDEKSIQFRVLARARVLARGFRNIGGVAFAFGRGGRQVRD
jgi:hypothetical protein